MIGSHWFSHSGRNKGVTSTVWAPSASPRCPSVPSLTSTHTSTPSSGETYPTVRALQVPALQPHQFASSSSNGFAASTLLWRVLPCRCYCLLPVPHWNSCCSRTPGGQVDVGVMPSVASRNPASRSSLEHPGTSIVDVELCLAQPVRPRSLSSEGATAEVLF